MSIISSKYIGSLLIPWLINQIMIDVWNERVNCIFEWHVIFLQAIAEVIGTKTDSHVRSFYVNYRRKYNLDAAVKEYESANGNSGITGETSKNNMLWYVSLLGKTAALPPTKVDQSLFTRT